MPFSAKAIPSRTSSKPLSGDGEGRGRDLPCSRFMAVLGKDILLCTVDEGLRQLVFNQLCLFSIKALPDDDGNLFALISKPPYVRVLQNEGGTLHPCGQPVEFPGGITEFGLSQHGGNVYVKCSVGAGSARSHYTFLANISGRYYTHQQTFFAQGYVRRFYSPTDDGE